MFPIDTDFKAMVTLKTEAHPIDEEPPFHILFFGDWSGRSRFQLDATSITAAPIEIDRDNFDEVMKNLGVGVNLKFSDGYEATLPISFTKLDDFHPDNIFQTLPLFADLRDVRERLIKADTFENAAREVRSWLISNEDLKAEHIINETEFVANSQSDSDDLLSKILDGDDENNVLSKNTNVEFTELSVLVKKLVKPHLIQTDTAEQSKLLTIVDEVIADLMRKIMHHPQFQSFESAWRAVYFIIRRIETNASLKFFLFDISKEELAYNLSSKNNLIDTDIYQTLVEQNSKPWALFCGNYKFELTIGDVATLIRLAKFAKNCDAPFVSYIESEMFNSQLSNTTSSVEKHQFDEDSTEDKLWMTLRLIPESIFLGLTFPRFLARLPYGEQTDITDTFYFEEFVSDASGESFLWANPSFICAFLFAQNFQHFGWNLASKFDLVVNDLPIYLYKFDDEIKIKSCTEIVMTERTSERMLKLGLMPLLSPINTDQIFLGRLQSIALPPSNLSGKWRK